MSDGQGEALRLHEEEADWIEFRVDGPPVAQPRQRVRIVTPRHGKPFASNYLPASDPVHDYKTRVASAANNAYWGVEPLTGPVEVEILAVFGRPQCRVWKRKPMPRTRKIGKPDFDNVAKAVCDALTGVVWRDDAQITDAWIRKREASGDETPHTIVRVRTLTEQPHEETR